MMPAHAFFHVPPPEFSHVPPDLLNSAQFEQFVRTHGVPVLPNNRAIQRPQPQTNQNVKGNTETIEKVRENWVQSVKEYVKKEKIQNKGKKSAIKYKIYLEDIMSYFYDILLGIESGEISIGGESPELTSIGTPGYEKKK